jgi:hypothetical protein
VADKLPRGSVKLATAAVVGAASDFGHGGLIAGDAETLARAALTAALPVVEKAARREFARAVLDRLHERDLYSAYYEMRRCLRLTLRGEQLPEPPSKEGDHA